MKTITITPADIKNYKIAFTDSGQVIDELAYSAGEATNEDIFEYDNGEPYKPYMYNYENDLFKATKNEDALYEMARTLEISLNANIGKLSIKAKMQAGAWLALHDDITWKKLLDAYTEALNDNRTDGISEAYNEQLQKEIDDFYKQQYKEWLYGNYCNYSGVIYLIGKYYTENPRECSYDRNSDEYTFALDEDIMRDELESYDGSAYSLSTHKDYLLTTIFNKSEARQYKEKQERKDRKIELERVAKYKAERQAQEDKKRKEKLLAMKIK